MSLMPNENLRLRSDYPGDRQSFEIESLRQQLATANAEIAHWKNNHATEVRRARILKERTDMPIERVQAYERWCLDLAENAALRQQLDEKDAEIERLKTVPMKYRRMAFNAQLQDENRELGKQLAASQLQNTQLQEALGFAEDCWFCEQTLTESVLTKMRHAIALPVDTSTLEALIAKAGEVMRERCMTQAVAGGIYAFSIRAIPGVTIGDLQK